MLVYIAILMPVLLLFCGLVVDVGGLEVKRLQMQSASDAAALGAELEIERGTGNWVAAAQGDASINGFTNGTASTVVAAAMKPTTGTYSGFYDAVQTTVSQPEYTSFLKILGKDPTTLNTRSVAIVTPCVYLMGAKNLTTYELTVTGGSTIKSNTAASSTPSCPYYIGGAASVDANTSFVALAENVTGSASGSTWSDTPYAAPRYGAATMADPLLTTVTQPTAGSCAATNTSASLTSNVAYGPGTYCGTTSLSCSSTSTTITLNPGLYVIAGSFSLNKCTLSGTGVSFFFTQYNGSYGQFTATNSIINLTAPTTSSGGSIPGVLMMTDRAWQTSNAQDIKLDLTTVQSDGIWYLPGAGFSFTRGYFAAPTYTGIVADNLLVSASTMWTPTNFSSLPGGNPFRPAGSLVE